MRLHFSEFDLQRMGSCSLQGRIVKELGWDTGKTLEESPWPQKITLIFHVTSTEWRKRHNGPRAVLLYEYNIPCLLEDILHIQQRYGTTFEIEEEIDDSREE